MNDNRRFIGLLVFAMAVGAASALALPVSSFGGVTLSGLVSAVDGGTCNIKGNISYNTSERIYHVPGGEF